ncbi:MAG: ribosomal protein S18-alanine N-acetyltransferase [Gammaproteobacteria bacterium]
MSAALEEGGAQFDDMRASDIAEVSAIEAATYPFPWTAGIFRDCLRARYRCRVLRDPAGIVAYGIVSTEAREAHILNLCVREALRRCGYGRRMLAHLLDLAIAAGARRVWLEVRRSNEAAVGLYSAAGFVEVGVRRDYYRSVDRAHGASRGVREDALVLALGLDDGEPR